jgi:beta-phosphoglucomutase-like phosphatase (HAD superfamily)
MIKGVIFDLNGVLVEEGVKGEVVQRVIDVINFASQDYKVAIATNRSRKTALPLLEGADLVGLFSPDNVITRSEAGIKKPHPRLYAMAASSLGLKTYECLAVDNKGIGIISALEAGCYAWKLKNFSDLTIENLQKRFVNPKYPGGVI